jgi:hypothetical protein
VIAAGAGGALETIVEGETGVLWTGGVDELVEAVRGFDALAVDPAACVANARRFDREVFRRVFPREVAAAVRARGARDDAHPDPRMEAARRPPRRRGGLARPLP